MQDRKPLQESGMIDAQKYDEKALVGLLSKALDEPILTERRSAFSRWCKTAGRGWSNTHGKSRPTTRRTHALSASRT